MVWCAVVVGGGGVGVGGVVEGCEQVVEWQAANLEHAAIDVPGRADLDVERRGRAWGKDRLLKINGRQINK